jgi:hypothetical protein
MTAMLLIASVATMMPVVAKAEESPSSLPDKVSAEPGRDRIEVRDEGDATVVDVYHVKGIGGAEVTLPKNGPQAIVFRFHDFPALESLTARSESGVFECMVIRPEGIPAQTICQLGGVTVDAMRISPGLIEVRLPMALLVVPGASAEVRWVDQWR